ncbi:MULTISPECIES: ORF6N domain-containing protein [Clostridium]|uniref:ORF6N domain-containing protein n=1 Tax=Clostridium TaxID=1485 RepID=UPI000E087E79|nr:ORF6N domain-containing protein [Clostridium sporogenes]MCW6085155.1 ORF6N domain-containing protein [Clostridium sporogenes]STC84128.1 Gp26 protein [Clostridium botulinum]
MNNLIKINNKNLQIKELKGQRVVTFKDIDILHERVEGTANKRFLDNQRHFINDTDYFEFTGEYLKEIKRLPNFGIGLNASKAIFITESGYLMLVKSLTDDLAWKVQRELVNNYFRVKENKVQVNQLSPELQMFNNLFKALATTELEQKKLNAAVQETKEEVQAIRDVVRLDTTSWKEDSTNLINKIAQSLGGFEYIREVRKEIYTLLDKRMGVNLEQRLTNKRRRMADEGVCKSKRDRLNKVSVIGDDKKLIEGYVSIVKEMAIKYGVKA